jgi:hypothetical protein
MSRLALILFVAIPGVVYSQADLGIKAGLNVSDIVMTNYIDPDVESDLRVKAGLHAGLFIRAMTNERFGLIAEVLYSNKGVKAAGTDIHLHYIVLPLMFQYKLTDVTAAELGPEPGYLFSAHSRHGNANSIYSNRFDLSLNGGFRFDTPKLIFGIRYSAGLFSVREPQINGTGMEKIKFQNRVLQFSIGYKVVTLVEKSLGARGTSAPARPRKR